MSADVPPAGRGHLALFSWQTILALRILNELHQRYGVEVSSWRDAIAQLQGHLRKRPFPSLWGSVAVFPSNQEAALRLEGEGFHRNQYLVIDLNPHLEALATPGDLPVESQLSLFPALAVRG